MTTTITYEVEKSLEKIDIQRVKSKWIKKWPKISDVINGFSRILVT
jgi:hypothetical protein